MPRPQTTRQFRKERPSTLAIAFLKRMAERALRIAATADIHYGKHSRGALHDAFAEVSRIADILLFCGDLTDYGLPEEAEELVADIRASLKIPMLAVLGNHDFESGQSELVCKVLDGAGVNVLDGQAIEIGGIGFAGVPGFGGGFGRRMLNAWANRSSNNSSRNPSITLFASNRRSPNCKPIGKSQSSITLQSAPRWREKIRKFLPFSVPAAWRSQSIDFASVRSFTAMHTTAFSMVQLRLAFRFTMSRRRRRCRRAASHTG